MGKSGGKGISYFGLVAMGIGCMLGTSWLLLTGTWLETAGGPLNLVVAFALCIIIELPFAFAYMEAIPMLPLPGGEVVYSYAAFGSRGGFAVGWAGILMNTIVFCWVDLAAVSLLDELFPALGRTAVLYELGDFPVTLPNVAIQLALAGAILWVQLRGQRVRLPGQAGHGGAADHVCRGAGGVLYPLRPGGVRLRWGAGLRLCRLGLPFVPAGVLRGRVGDGVQGCRRRLRPRRPQGGSRPHHLPVPGDGHPLPGVHRCGRVYALAGGGGPHRPLSRRAGVHHRRARRAGALPSHRLCGRGGGDELTSHSSAQMLYGLSRFALVSRAFSALHPKYGTPARCIWFTAAFVVLTPFTGRLFFLPFINIASLATIVMDHNPVQCSACGAPGRTSAARCACPAGG